ncbi:hypothetical protein K432DRAFT_286133 [Lepidopterella palustris CBS 459.81]|uniref:DUF7730 domain-containing protein n=1 Tax=Lepidopterella palustris CBS 459.81 TaxID=1314670 RepID=A0A8E2EKX3_9PEZI|nr:hypothetical protein K432DRAFT_286133 [Lepidopterella palustris CBS 459.81]
MSYTRRRRADAPPPLPQARKRSLSLSGSSPAPITRKEGLAFHRRRVEQKFLDQLQSPLFGKLPTEIRLMIWEHVVGNSHIHVVRMPKKLCHVNCKSATNNNSHVPHVCSCTWRRKILDTTDCVVSSKTPDHLLSLLKSCRRSYSEAIDILYKCNIFDINYLDTLNYLNTTILRQRWDQIQSLHLTWNFNAILWRIPSDNTKSDIFDAPFSKAAWYHTCHIISGMKGLKNLLVIVLFSHPLSLNSIYPSFDTPYYPEVLKALMPISVPGTFDVYVPWSNNAVEKLVGRNGTIVENGSNVKNKELPFTVKGLASVRGFEDECGMPEGLG